MIKTNIGNAISRRKFIKSSGGLLFVISSGIGIQSCIRDNHNNLVIVNPWVKIRPDGNIIIYNPAAEMGQGSMTALPLIVAEEMDADWDKVSIEFSPIDAETYGHDGWGSRQMMAIVGSYAVEGYFQKLRVAGAQVRQILLSIVSRHWSVAMRDLSASKGFVYDRSRGKKISYGEIANLNVPFDLVEADEDPPLKNFEEFVILGKEIPRADIPSKVDGSAVYSIDVFLEDLVFGMIEKYPVKDARPTLLNKSEIEALQGILSISKIVDSITGEESIGIIATNPDTVFRAKAMLEINWQINEDYEKYNSELDEYQYRKSIDDQGIDTVELGKIGNRLKSSDSNRIIRQFYNDYTYHAQLEPLNATVCFDNAKQQAEVWIGTQAPDTMLRQAAISLGLQESQISLHQCYLGGAFGRRTRRDYLLDACSLAKISGRPTKLMWSREDDFKNGMFRPNALQQIEAKLDEDGTITHWEYKVVGQQSELIHTGAGIPFYNIPNQYLEAKYIESPIKTNSWRAEGHGPNKFAIEAFMDELSVISGTDPIDFRIKHIGNSKALGVIRRVREMSGWDDLQTPGRAKGFSFCERSAITATVCEISCSKRDGKIKVHRIWIALNAGFIVQPGNAKAQVEGAIIMAISSLFNEVISFSNGRVEQTNFHNYDLLRANEAPESIDIEFLKSDDNPVGVAEAGIPGIGGAIANAFAALTGKRLYRMPFTKERITHALSL